jgi:hypothetical protein
MSVWSAEFLRGDDNPPHPILLEVLPMSRLGILTTCALLGLFAYSYAQTRSDQLVLAKEPQAKKDDLKNALNRIAELERELAAVKAPKIQKGSDNIRDIMQQLKQPMETRGLQERVKMKTALDFIAKELNGKLPILIDRDAFAAELGADAPDPYEEEVSLPPVPAKMPIGTALRLLLSQVGKGYATFVIRHGYLEIVTYGRQASAYMLAEPSIIASFECRPLTEVLEELSEETGLTIHLDPNIVKRNELLVSASFRNCSLEDALIVVTEMAQLKFVVLARSIYVTTPENAKIIQKEEAARSKIRVRPGYRRLEAAA